MPRFSPKILALMAGAVALGALLAVLYVILLAPVHAVPEPPAVLAQLKPAEKAHSVPDVAFSDAAGHRRILAQYRGRYVLLNLWATWCNPCIRELPALAGLKAALPSDRIAVLAVNVGRSDAARTASFLDRHQASDLGVYLDSDIALMRAFDAYGLPFTVLIDPEGREVARAFGPADWSAPAAIAYFKALPWKQQKTARR
ncbi:MAG: TlpA family protein disulfide reductase [Alphaproteobacteria bacterium]|nr:TlpA family protein disulfide reductase [Alphaproteobacteria bacterium]MDE2013946.1 TlpA family protein disulfide reductase [Alphaproteobacteria bacterium]MDE2351027.1 TlpA family protein disulfide reductase [Alphaproteobacteria bacterium]